MEQTESSGRVDLSVPSLMDYLSVIDAVSEEITGRLGLDEDVRNAVNNSVIEAATNAIEHGNHQDVRKRVRVRFLASSERIEVDVSDEGTGFDPGLLEDPVLQENLMRVRGRGIFIMRSYMDDVAFRFEPARGTTVHMMKKLR
ncbi:MAG: ATP-binding protein [Candidatus Eisenbacteria bacterium]|nr:ATP-binding protein [Candidatus Eisenbacteria bacterium]